MQRRPVLVCQTLGNRKQKKSLHLDRHKEKTRLAHIYQIRIMRHQPLDDFGESAADRRVDGRAFGDPVPIAICTALEQVVDQFELPVLARSKRKWHKLFSNRANLKSFNSQIEESLSIFRAIVDRFLLVFRQQFNRPLSRRCIIFFYQFLDFLIAPFAHFA